MAHLARIWLACVLALLSCTVGVEGGAAFSKILGSMLLNRNVRILMLGLDGAGKTTVLYRLKLNKYITTAPTIGFNAETLKYRNLEMTVWDVGGQEKIRPLWRHYCRDTQALIFVVDSNDKDRLDEAGKALAPHEPRGLRHVVYPMSDRPRCTRAYPPTVRVSRIRAPADARAPRDERSVCACAGE